MFEFNLTNLDANTQDEPYEKAYAIAREVFDEEDKIEEEAARLYGVSVEYVKKGMTGNNPTPRIGNWIKARRIEAGWKYLEK